MTNNDDRGMVLVADDDAAIRTVLSQALSRAGFDVRTTATFDGLMNWVSNGEGDALICDVNMPDGNAFDFLPSIKRIRKELPVIVMSAQNTFMTAIKASENDAYDYLPKPFDLQELITITTRAINEPKNSIKKDSETDYSDGMPLIGRSPAMQEIYRILARLMQNDLTLLISGESGTGKELVARALHEYGLRKNHPFVAINMAAIPKDLIEAELFGYEKGAFTGAHSKTSGHFEKAEGGTLFLDEIGDMPMDAQTRLLRVLQQGEYTTIGGKVTIKTNVRIVAASNKDLQSLINKGLFREDLYFRLNVVPLKMPPLRERKEDIPDLARHFFTNNTKDGLPEKIISPEGLEVLAKYSWPGNVRELENLIRRLSALYSQEVFDAEIIEEQLGIDSTFYNSMSDTPSVTDISQATEYWIKHYFESYHSQSASGELYKEVLEKIEKPMILSTLAYTHGNQVKAAEILGLNRNTLRKKIQSLNIDVLKI